MKEEMKIFVSVGWNEEPVTCAITGILFPENMLNFKLKDGRHVCAAAAMKSGFTITWDNFKILEDIIEDWFEMQEKIDKKKERREKRRKKIIAAVIERLPKFEDIKDHVIETTSHQNSDIDKDGI